MPGPISHHDCYHWMLQSGMVHSPHSPAQVPTLAGWCYSLALPSLTPSLALMQTNQCDIVAHRGQHCTLAPAHTTVLCFGSALLVYLLSQPAHLLTNRAALPTWLTPSPDSHAHQRRLWPTRVCQVRLPGPHVPIGARPLPP